MAAVPANCPGCGRPYEERTRLDLALVRREDAVRVCKAIYTCANCTQRWWRWNDRPEDPLQQLQG